MEINRAVARRLRMLRGSLKETEVAARCGISLKALRAYESGERMPRDEIKLAFAEIYHVDIEYIFLPNKYTFREQLIDHESERNLHEPNKSIFEIK